MKLRIEIFLTILIFLTVQSCKTLDATKDAKELCEVHDQKMNNTWTWIKYGRRDMKNLKTDLLDYPHPKTNFYGGDRIYKERPKIYKYYYCKKCNKAKKREKK